MSASAEMPNNSSCNLSAECASMNCNAGVCCDPGECGYPQYNRCFADGAKWAIGPGTTFQCVNGTRLNAYGSHCSGEAECATGRCINGACCDPGQCAYQFQSPFRTCVDVNETVDLPSGAIVCASEGVWMKANNQTCLNGTECFSGVCNAGVCCGSGECGFSLSPSSGSCYADGAVWSATAGSSYQCVNGTRMRAYGSGCLISSECVTGVCVNSACCYAGQCAYQFQSSYKACVNVNETRPPYGDVCVSEGVWKTGYGRQCTLSDQCATGNCASLVCCNLTDCSLNGTCYASGYSIPETMYCYNGGWLAYPDYVTTSTSSTSTTTSSSTLSTSSITSTSTSSSTSTTTTSSTSSTETASTSTSTAFSTTATSSSTSTSSTTMPCFPGVRITAEGTGTFMSRHPMQLLIDGAKAAEWNALDVYGEYEYVRNLSCGRHTIDVVNNGTLRTLRVYGINVECAEASGVVYDRAVGSTPFDGIDVMNSTGTMPWPGSLRFAYEKNCGECELAGDLPPCGEISLQEVIGLINEWADGRAALGDAVRLIAKWSE